MKFFFIVDVYKRQDFYKTRMMFLDAKPNAAHLKLAEMENSGKLTAVITQNIDGLHQMAGSKNVLELHGSVHRNYCQKCGKFYDAKYVKESEGIPRCECGGIIKPDVCLLYTSPQAIEDAKLNAKINQIENAEFYVGKAEEVLPEYYAEYEKKYGEKAHADVIVVDPPRKGCEESLLQTMVDMEPERIVYVSCDSATLARDLKFLCGNGYEIQKVRPVDMFPHTVHVETCVLLQRRTM